MKYVKIVIIFFTLITIPKLFSQTNEYSSLMYVNTEEGLRVRKSPGINSERIGLLPHLAQVEVRKEDENYVVIDNIRGKWVYIYSVGYMGWVFGGYLMNDNAYRDYLKTIDIEHSFLAPDLVKFPSAGEEQWWQNNSMSYYMFSSDGNFKWEPYGSDISSLGIWYIEDGKLFLEYKISIGNGTFDFVFLNCVRQFSFINNNVIIEENPIQKNCEREVLVKVEYFWW